MCAWRRGVGITDNTDVVSEMRARILGLGDWGANRSRQNLQFRVILVEIEGHMRDCESID